MIGDPGKLQTCASLPVDSPLWVQLGQQDELAEADLKYIGPRTRGSSAVYFGVQLKVNLNPCALFLPVSHVHVRTWTRNNLQDAQERAKERDRHRSSHGNGQHNNGQHGNGQHGNGQHNNERQHPQHQGRHISFHNPRPSSPPVRAPASPPPLHVGQRVMFPIEDNVYGGEVRFCGLLPGRSSSGMYVGILLDAPVGQWDGLYKGEKLCNIPSLLYGALVPINKIRNPTVTRLLTNPTSPTFTPTHTPTHTSPEHPHHNGVHGPPSLRSPVSSEAVEEDGEAGLDGGLEVGSMVEVNDPPLFGVIRWIGRISGVGEPVAGIELDQDLSAGTDGSYLGERHFRCPANKGLSADWVLFWPSEPDSDSGLAQDLLRCEIVNPLRRYGYVCASKTMALRRLLEAANSNMGFTNQEKDPEEFLNKLFQLLQVEPLLKIRSMTQQSQEGHLYQLFPPTLPPSPTSPLLISPIGSPIPLAPPSPSRMRAPSCLLLLMPRFGKDFKMFDAILPTLSLDITDLLDDTLRQCSICQAVAEWECLACYEDPDITPGVHSHRKRASHHPVDVTVPGGPWTGPLLSARQRMSLFAVTCIETSHYVGRFLSLSEEELSRVDPASIRESARRLLCDSYMCLYHSPDLSLYK
ncbi:hypothetical protein F7725_004794 [Dissostichus mawsoni]|uniref:ubiquitinyl hydrolase 1 n=1 Tax=Dissostichus mawsoni TaxID=36200 RepID=A0A7J5XK32_DISMA|nr:hypothetical protein F7725_004794 [Dissostichus mawsoni]